MGQLGVRTPSRATTFMQVLPVVPPTTAAPTTTTPATATTTTTTTPPKPATLCSEYEVKGADATHLNGLYVPCTEKVFKAVTWHSGQTLCRMLQGNTRVDYDA